VFFSLSPPENMGWRGGKRKATHSGGRFCLSRPPPRLPHTCATFLRGHLLRAFSAPKIIARFPRPSPAVISSARSLLTHIPAAQKARMDQHGTQNRSRMDTNAPLPNVRMESEHFFFSAELGSAWPDAVGFELFPREELTVSTIFTPKVLRPTGMNESDAAGATSNSLHLRTRRGAAERARHHLSPLSPMARRRRGPSFYSFRPSFLSSEALVTAARIFSSRNSRLWLPKENTRRRRRRRRRRRCRGLRKSPAATTAATTANHCVYTIRCHRDRFDGSSMRIPLSRGAFEGWGKGYFRSSPPHPFAR